MVNAGTLTYYSDSACTEVSDPDDDPTTITDDQLGVCAASILMFECDGTTLKQKYYEDTSNDCQGGSSAGVGVADSHPSSVAEGLGSPKDSSMEERLRLARVELAELMKANRELRSETRPARPVPARHHCRGHGSRI